MFFRKPGEKSAPETRSHVTVSPAVSRMRHHTPAGKDSQGLRSLRGFGCLLEIPGIICYHIKQEEENRCFPRFFHRKFLSRGFFAEGLNPARRMYQTEYDS